MNANTASYSGILLDPIDEQIVQHHPDELNKIRETKVSLHLFAHYEISEKDPNRWRNLALALAIDHVPGLQVRRRTNGGRKPKVYKAILSEWPDKKGGGRPIKYSGDFLGSFLQQIEEIQQIKGWNYRGKDKRAIVELDDQISARSERVDVKPLSKSEHRAFISRMQKILGDAREKFGKPSRNPKPN